MLDAVPHALVFAMALMVGGCARSGPVGEAAAPVASATPEPAPATRDPAEAPREITDASPSPAASFWAPLARPGAVFVLHDELAEADAPRTLEIAVTNLREVEGVTVVELTWTKVDGADRQVGDSTFEVVMLRGGGARIMWGESVPDDDLLVDWGREPLTYAARPREGDEWFGQGPPALRTPDVVCLYWDDSVEGEDCEDTCDGTACFSATDGVVLLEGLLAPEYGSWAAVPGSSQW